VFRCTQFRCRTATLIITISLLKCNIYILSIKFDQINIMSIYKIFDFSVYYAVVINIGPFNLGLYIMCTTTFEYKCLVILKEHNV
jgi:hypothetical protein